MWYAEFVGTFMSECRVFLDVAEVMLVFSLASVLMVCYVFSCFSWPKW